MKDKIKKYHRQFIDLVNSLEVTDHSGKVLDFDRGIELICSIIKKQAKLGGKIFFIGNGGSSAIASHMTVDFWKNASIPAMAFTDNALLTCMSNDFGYEYVFAKPISFFAGKNDILFVISSSGKSKNILRAVKAMKGRGGRIVTFSGFREDNPLRSKGIYNFYVPSREYGPVEVLHQYICHFILDLIVNNKLSRQVNSNE